MLEFPKEWSNLDAALCHDWLTGMRGGERVLEILCDGFPRAPIYTLIHNRDAISNAINRHPSQTSFLRRLPGVHRYYRNLLPLFPAAVRSLPPPGNELLVSTSHCVAKSLRSSPDTCHVCYCFTPMRYAWTFFDEYFGNGRVKGLIAKPILAALRRWDRKTASRVDRFVAISNHVRHRIERFYGREADVVYPPVDTERCTPGESSHAEEFDLIVSALVPYKRVDLAVAAYSRLELPLKVVGIGGELARLKTLAGPSVEFLEWQSDDEVLDLYRGCRFLLFPGEEDFGIVPLEAQACGKPVIAYGRGGALETVVDGTTGVFFDRQTEDALTDAVQRARAVTWDTATVRRHAEQFDNQCFVDGLAKSIEAALAARPEARGRSAS